MSRPRSIADRAGPAIVALALASLQATAADGGKGCADCHPRQAAAFERSAMARAAVTPAFTAERADAADPRRCLRCHAPGGGRGVACGDCHGSGPHPFPPLEQPAVCARCHDAPGENTVRSFLDSPAFAAGLRCSDCHAVADGGFNHHFRGARSGELLRDAATLRAFLRSEGDRTLATVTIRHRAGHAMPGGTTGRAVWLRISGRDEGGRERLDRRWRFGWNRDREGRWHDRTLPPGRPVTIELPLSSAAGIRHLTIELTYRFRPGPLDTPDPDAVILDRMEIELP